MILFCLFIVLSSFGIVFLLRDHSQKNTEFDHTTNAIRSAENAEELMETVRFWFVSISKMTVKQSDVILDKVLLFESQMKEGDWSVLFALSPWGTKLKSKSISMFLYKP